MKKKTLLFLLCLLPLLCACGGKQTVTIFDSGVTTTLELSLPRTVRSVLDRAEITLRDGDEVIPPPDTMLREAGEITVRREAVVLLNMCGEVRTVVAYGLTAGQLLEREGITLREGQHLSCDPGTYLKSGMELKVSDMVNVHLIHDGAEEGREPLSEVVLEPPVTQIIKKGPKDLSVVSIVSQKVFYDCDGSGHGYYEIHYSDDTVEYERF